MQNFKACCITSIYTLASICNMLSADCHSADFCRHCTIINGGLEKSILWRRHAEFYHRINLFIFVRFSGLLKNSHFILMFLCMSLNHNGCKNIGMFYCL